MAKQQPEEFILKQNSYEEEVQVDECRSHTIKVSRTRTSAGHCAIFLKVGDKPRIELSNDATTYGDAYTKMASTIATLLRKAIDDPCSLPRT
jgi:hypothetical protein